MMLMRRRLDMTKSILGLFEEMAVIPGYGEGVPDMEEEQKAMAGELPRDIFNLKKKRTDRSTITLQFHENSGDVREILQSMAATPMNICGNHMLHC